MSIDDEKGPAMICWREAMKVRGISPAMKLVLLDISWRSDTEAIEAVDPAEVAESTEMSRSTVYEALRALTDAGYLREDRLPIWCDRPISVARRQAEQVVYFIQSAEGGPIKIGVAANPQARLMDLQVDRKSVV